MNEYKLKEEFEKFITYETGYSLERTAYPMTKDEDQMYKDLIVQMCWLSVKHINSVIKNKC